MQKPFRRGASADSAKTDGVSLFVEEITKSLLASGQLKAVDGTRTCRRVVMLAIPATLQDSLMARLDRSSRESR